MTYETGIQIGVDLIAPAVTIFVVWYGLFRPWYTHHIGRALFLHAFGSMLLFDLAFLAPWLPETYPGQQPITLFVVTLWAIGWWYLVFALWLTQPRNVGAGR